MKVYGSNSSDGVTEVYWSKEGAFEQPGDSTVAEIEPLKWVVDEYFKFRKYKEPTAQEAFLFLVSEVGELAEAIKENSSFDHSTRFMRQVIDDQISLGKWADGILAEQGGWVRNNDRIKTPDLSAEFGDVLMMLVKTAAKLNIDPVEAMFDKMEKKGWER